MDPNGKEVLNGYEKNEVKNVPLLMAVTRMKQAEDPQIINLYGHGNSKGFSYTDSNGKADFISDTKGLVGFLKANSKVWNNRKSGDNISIVLHSCETGKETKDEPVSFAQKVSKDMPNVTLIAPNENIGFTANGIEQGSIIETTDNKGKVISNEFGHFSEFKNGEKTNTYSGSAKVGTKEFNTPLNKIKEFLKSRL